MATTPAVSVIVPNYNHAQFLKQRLDSVLGQTFTDTEVIILDDCSADSSREVIEAYRTEPRVNHIVYNSTNSGSTFAQWKRGLELARGRYVWIAESDDWAEPEFLDTLIRQLELYPSAVMAFSGSRMVDSTGCEIMGMDWDRWHRDMPPIEIYSGVDLIKKFLLWTSDVYNASMVVFRRDAAPLIERQLSMRYCGDWLFWVDLARKGDAIAVRKKLNNFRQHDAKVSPSASKEGLYFIEGLPIMAHIAEKLAFSPVQRRMLAGRAWKRLKKFPNLLASHRDEVMMKLDALSSGASAQRRKLIALYEADKYLNFTGLQPKR